MASIAELTQQVVMLTDQVATLNDRLTVAEQIVTTAQAQGGGGGMGRGTDSGIFDKKRLYPKELRDQTSFRSWAERFIAWITMAISEQSWFRIRSTSRGNRTASTQNSV